MDIPDQHYHRSYSCNAFSLLEMLVVMSIFFFMLALMVPGIQTVREQSRRIVCSNNLRQWGIATQAYRHDYNDYLPMEGTYLGKGDAPGTWYNELPYYLDAPAYKDIEGVNDAIKEFPNLDVWICPSKNLTKSYKSWTGKNQFHYGMNQVLDGLGKPPDGSKDMPGYPDIGKVHTPTSIYANQPNTIFMFDIYQNSPAGTARNVATMYHKYRGKRVAKFHGDYANLLYLHGGVTNCTTDDLVTNKDFRKGDIVWNHPRLYWGYPRRYKD